MQFVNDAPQITQGPRRFNTVNALKVRNVDAEVDVQPHDSDAIELTVVGTLAQIRAINVRREPTGALVIEGAAGDNGYNQDGTCIESLYIDGPAVIGSGATVQNYSNGDRMTTTIRDSSFIVPPAKVTINVPTGTPVRLFGITGNTIVGATCGPLVATAGDGDIYAHEVTSAELKTMGSGNIRARAVNGNVTATTAGEGGIKVENGTIPMLTVHIQSAGDVRIDTTVDSASPLSDRGGDIEVAHVRGHPKITRNSYGEIIVKATG